MQKTRIIRFKITKLFGYQNVDIDFDGRYKIVVGENGLGKTTILNCLYYLLDKKFKKLNNIKFERIELYFSNKNKLSFSKLDLEFYIEKPTKIRSSGFYDLLSKKLTKDDIKSLKEVIYSKKISDQQRRFTVVEILNKIDVKVNAPTKYIYDNILKFIVEKEAINFQKVIDTIDKNVKSKILYFPTYRRIESQLETLTQKFKSRKEYYDNPFYDDEFEDQHEDEYDDVIQFGMEDVRQKIDSITNEIRQKSLIGFSKITGDLLSQLSKEFPSYRNKSDINEKKLKIILDRVGKSISIEDKTAIINYINSGNRTNKGLLYFIHKLIDLYDEQEILDVAIKNFVETCNRYLNLKILKYNESSIKLEIQRENSVDIITLDQLSSGEKQIVSLFSKIYLDLEKSFIVLFDEPELSLSIDWQQKLLPDIIKSDKCNFMFTVTHSPFIYDNIMNEYASGLTDYTSF